MCNINEGKEFEEDNRRKVEVLDIGGQWVGHTEGLRFVHKGNKFRMFEPTGEHVKDKKGRTEYVATSDAYKSELYAGYQIDVDDD